MYSVMSTPTPTSRPLLLGVGAATTLLIGLHFALDAPLGMTEGRFPADRFFILWQFAMSLVVLQIGSRLMRSVFAHRAQRLSLPKAGTEKLLVVNASMANKAIYALIYLYLVLGIWIPKIL
jgi:hypothetical protein